MPPWRSALIVAWCGMRGAVSLAAALALPLTTDAGAPFPAARPHRLPRLLGDPRDARCSRASRCRCSSSALEIHDDGRPRRGRTRPASRPREAALAASTSSSARTGCATRPPSGCAPLRLPPPPLHGALRRRGRRQHRGRLAGLPAAAPRGARGRARGDHLAAQRRATSATRSCAASSATSTSRTCGSTRRWRRARPRPRRGAAARRGGLAQLLVLDLALELLQRAAQVPATVGAATLLGQPAAASPRRRRRRRGAARRACGRPARSRRRQRPRWSMPVTEVQASSRRLVVLDDLDEAADLGRADAHEHPVARAEPARLLAGDLPARDAGHEVQVARRVGDELPHDLGRGRDVDRRARPSSDHREAPLGGAARRGSPA